jgi:glutamate 5-kinase
VANQLNSILDDATCVVIKIGSSLLVADDGKLRVDWLESIADDIDALKTRGKQVIIVSSGAIALGKRWLGIEGRPQKLDDAQAAAAIGQIKLARAFEECLGAKGHTVAQLLLTLDDMEDRARYLNARNTMNALLGKRIVPLINENDTVATNEIRFGDNDRLAARTAQLAGAELLFLLSDIDGLYDVDPTKNEDAALIPLVEEISADIIEMAGPSASIFGTGGMATKVAAAQIALPAGCSMTISNGHTLSPIKAIIDGARHTLFASNAKPLDARRGWIKGLKSPTGTVIVDNGAVKALKSGASLLAVGIIGVEGSFERGALVQIVDDSKTIIGQGLMAYNADDTRQIMTKQAKDIESILGYAGRPAVIHRDDLVLD